MNLTTIARMPADPLQMLASELLEALKTCHDALVRIREAGGQATSAEIVAEQAIANAARASQPAQAAAQDAPSERTLAALVNLYTVVSLHCRVPDYNYHAVTEAAAAIEAARASQPATPAQDAAAVATVMALIEDYAKAVHDGDDAACVVFKRTIEASLEGMAATPAQDAAATVQVEGEGWLRVRVDTKPDAEGWCFCTPVSHPDDMAKGWPQHDAGRQTFGQVFATPAAHPVAWHPDDAALEAAIEASDGAWHDDEFRITPTTKEQQ